MLGLGGRRVAVAGAWALTLGIGPLARDSTHGAIHRAPGRRREQARERPGETWPNCGCAVQLEGGLRFSATLCAVGDSENFNQGVHDAVAEMIQQRC